MYSPVSTRRCFDVHVTSITLKRRRTDVKTTSCAYWECVELMQVAFCMYISIWNYWCTVLGSLLVVFRWCHFQALVYQDIAYEEEVIAKIKLRKGATLDLTLDKKQIDDDTE